MNTKKNLSLIACFVSIVVLLHCSVAFAETIFAVKCQIPKSWSKDYTKGAFVSSSPDKSVCVYVETLKVLKYKRGDKSSMEAAIHAGIKTTPRVITGFKEQSGSRQAGKFKSGLLYFQLYGTCKLKSKPAECNAFVVFTEDNPVLFTVTFSEKGKKHSSDISAIINSIAVVNK